MLGRLALSLGALAAGGCVDVSGGAVELAWVVRSDDGRAISDCTCSSPRIDRLRLVLRRGDGATPCDGRGACEWSCKRGTGATPFDIEPATYEVSLVPLDAAGQDLTVASGPEGPVQVPAPILRDVVRGQATEMEALAVVAHCAADCSGSNSSGVCKRQ